LFLRLALPLFVDSQPDENCILDWLHHRSI
jgi:hypothetical protein